MIPSDVDIRPRRTFFCLRLTSLDLTVCPYHMTFLIKILKQLMRSTQENITMSFILKLEYFGRKTDKKLKIIR
jgi:hypothetical protein